jgi:DNA (cytosine-5)-methyltransferase 1
MNVLDLFSGIGGFSLGLERAGMRTVAFCELDERCRHVLAKHWAGIPAHDDITTRQFSAGEADIICGGFPCQDISLAGTGAGLAGERSGLWRELLRAIRVVRPRYAIVENVAALLSRGMGTVLGDLAAVGYDAEWHCIPASAVGAPHRRDRVWIIADPGSEQYKSHRTPLSGEIAAQLSQAATDAHRVTRPECRPGDASEGEGRRDVGAGCRRADQMDDALCGRHASPQGEISTGRDGSFDAGWWAVEPDVGRVAHGVPDRVDRLGELGNAVVPQIPEIIARAILEAERANLNQ